MLRAFFRWLVAQPGYKSKITYTNTDWTRSEKDARIAKARRDKPVPTLEQINAVLAAMPNGTDIELRDRALIAFTILTGARAGALASFKLRHVDIDQELVFQDGSEVKTKASKTFNSWFFPVGDEPRRIVVEWVQHLRERLLWGNHHPLFPKTQIVPGAGRAFEAVGLARECWSTSQPIREIFRQAFARAGLHYFNPHSFRNTLAQLGERVCPNKEAQKAWSQTLGHDNEATTWTCYGAVAPARQAEIMRQLWRRRPPPRRKPPRSSNRSRGWSV